MDFAAGNPLIARSLKKSEEWHKERRLGIGGSDAGKVYAGEWRDLWLEKTGRNPPEDLSNNLAVAMGTWTEALNRYWFQEQMGKAVTVFPDAIPHRHIHFMRANLDGYIKAESAVFEAKHVGAYIKDEEVVSRYYAQAQHLMEVAGAPVCYLSVFFGNSRWAWFDVHRDEEFIAELIAKEREFWGYVERDEMPPDVAAGPAVEIAFDTMREVDLSASNAWCSFAADWLKHRHTAKLFDTATKELKAMVEADVKLAHGGGVTVSRSKAGALTVKEARQ